MAIIHQATLTPTKQELLSTELDGPVEVVASYRLDDPAGEVGVEGFILRQGAELSHVVLTYRAAPIEDDGSARLVGTLEHSTLGPRWVYDGATDPVALGCLHRVLLGQQGQAVLEIWSDGERVGTREPSATLAVSPGRSAVPAGDQGAVRILHRLDTAVGSGPSLTASWSGGDAVVAELAPTPG